MTPGRALITGGTRGIGRQVALGLAQRGVRVALGYRDRADEAQATLAELAGGGHVTVAGDLRTVEGAAEAFAAAERALGPIDLLVNNAGLFRPHRILDPAMDLTAWRGAWEETLALNLRAPAELCFLAGRAMAARGGGRIVSVSSRGAFRGEPNAPAYGASKAGLNALSQSLAKALAPSGVFVAAVAPGWVETEMSAGRVDAATLADQPLGRIATPDEVAAAVVWLALEAPLSATGAILDLNGASYLRT